MQCSANVTEAQLVAAIDKIMDNLASNFQFGIYDADDIRQEGALWAMEALPRWDGVRPLENFLYSHVKNRLINLKRDKYHRYDPPCVDCANAAAAKGPSPHSHGWCKRFLEWQKRNHAKTLLATVGASDDKAQFVDREPEAPDAAIIREAIDIIRDNLDLELLPHFLAMRAGASVPPEYRKQVEVAVREIVEEYDLV